MNGASIIAGVFGCGLIGLFWGKDRSIGPILAFMLGAVLGPIGWIIIACSPKSMKEDKNEYKCDSSKEGPINKVGIVVIAIVVVIILFVIFAKVVGNNNRDVSGAKSHVEKMHSLSLFIPDNWKSYAINDAFILSVPPSLELRQESDNYTQHLNDMHLRANSGAVVFQQKGLANETKDGKSKYCRIIIQYYDGDYGDYYLADQTVLIDEEIKRHLYEMAEAELMGVGRFIGNVDYDWVSLDNIKALRTSYRRTGYNGAPPVLCQIFLMCNSKEMVKIVMSYRESEADLWKSDFEKIIRTFKWQQIY